MYKNYTKYDLVSSRENIDYFVNNLKSFSQLPECIRDAFLKIGYELKGKDIDFFDDEGDISFRWNVTPSLSKVPNVRQNYLAAYDILSEFFTGVSKKSQKNGPIFKIDATQMLALNDVDKKFAEEIKKRYSYRKEKKELALSFQEEIVPVLLICNLDYQCKKIKLEELSEKILQLKSEMKSVSKELTEMRETIIKNNSRKYTAQSKPDFDNSMIENHFKDLQGSGLRILREDRTPF